MATNVKFWIGSALPSESGHEEALTQQKELGSDELMDITEWDDSKDPAQELAELQHKRKHLAQRLRQTKTSAAQSQVRLRKAEREYQTCAEALSEFGPEVQEASGWRELARQHMKAERDLRRTLEAEREEHQRRVKELQNALRSDGAAASEKAQEAEKNRAKRIAVEVQCSKARALLDYIKGKEHGMTLEELGAFLDDRSPAAVIAPAEVQRCLQRYEALLEAMLQQIQEEGQQRRRDLVQLSNAAITRKEFQLETLGEGALARCLEDVDLCAPEEQLALRELLPVLDHICTQRVVALGA